MLALNIDGSIFIVLVSISAHWSVINEGNNVVRLLNSNYYLAILSGSTCLLTSVIKISFSLPCLTQIRMLAKSQWFAEG